MDDKLLTKEELIENGYNYDDLEMDPWSEQLFIQTGEEKNDLVPVNGLVYELSDDHERVLYWGEYEDGLDHGLSVFYHPNGQIKNKATIFHGTGHGWSRQWDEQGNLMFLGEYIHGISVRFRGWAEAGELIDEKTGPSETERVIIGQRMLEYKKNWQDEGQC